jgi:hypothetical protein
MKILFNNHYKLKDENFKSIWGALYSDFNDSKPAILFYTLFFIRIIILSTSFIYLKEYPRIQVLSCSIACLMVRNMQMFIYVTVVRPYRSRVQNIVSIITELNITLGYSFNIFFIIQGEINNEKAAWIILASIISTYVIHNLLIFYNIIRSIIKYLRSRCSRARRGTIDLIAANT